MENIRELPGLSRFLYTSTFRRSPAGCQGRTGHHRECEPIRLRSTRHLTRSRSRPYSIADHTGTRSRLIRGVPHLDRSHKEARRDEKTRVCLTQALGGGCFAGCRVPPGNMPSLISYLVVPDGRVLAFPPTRSLSSPETPTESRGSLHLVLHTYPLRAYSR